MMEKLELLTVMKRFVVLEAVPANALRNQGAGVPQQIQAALADVDVETAPTADAATYRRWLDRQTDKILRTLETNPKPWGTARKALNLLMRSCICNHYLRQAYHLERIEQLAELPLDGVVATAIKQRSGRGRLPQWPGLKNLRPDVNRRFQDAACEIADRLGLHPRVYLDNYLWVENRIPKQRSR